MHARSGRSRVRTIGRVTGLLLGLLVAISAVFASASAPAARAAGSPPRSDTASSSSTGDGGIPGTYSLTTQDPHWLALKLAGRVRSGATRGEVKGTPSHPYISATSNTTGPTPYSVCTDSCGGPGGSSCNYCAELSTTNFVPNSFEPGNGVPSCGSPCRSNFTGLSNNVRDDACSYNGCYTDGLFFYLCGPGAADVALEYWPWPPNLRNYTVKEYVNNVTTTWNGNDTDGVYRARGYMLHLAYEIHPPTWPRAGINMQQADWTSSTPPRDAGTGATLSIERDGLNWEASGENSSNWSNYFYATVYTDNNQATLHSDIVEDINVDSRPVVLLVNTNGLQNWGFSGNA